MSPNTGSVTETDNNAQQQPASPARNAQASGTARGVQKGMYVVGGIGYLVPTLFFLGAAILCVTQGFYWGLLFLIGTAWYGRIVVRCFTA